MEVRKEDGTLYKKTSQTALRFGLKREIKKILSDLNIIDDPASQSSSEIFKAQCMQVKMLGLAEVNHRSQISKADMELLYSSGVFSATKPSSLQNKAFLEFIMFYLCRRGHENLRMLDKYSFEVKEFPDGKKYVVYTKDELRKKRVDNELVEVGYIVGTGENCPVKSFLLYASKLNPKLKTGFQRPNDKIPADGPWFDNQVIGVKTIEKMMKTISIRANLSQIYTNHSIRATLF